MTRRPRSSLAAWGAALLLLVAPARAQQPPVADDAPSATRVGTVRPAGDAPVPSDGVAAYPAELVRAFEALPVQDGGRVKPLRSLADVTLLRFTGRRALVTADGARLDAPRWLLRVLLFPERAVDDPLFLVQDDAVIRAVELPVGAHRKRDRWSFRELEPALPELFELAHRWARLDEAERSSVQQQLMALASNVDAFLGLLAPMEASDALALLPPTVSAARQPEWSTPGELERRGRERLPVPPEHARLMSHWQELRRAREQPARVAEHLAAFADGTRALMAARGEGARVEVELAYHRWGLLRGALAAFLAAFLAVAWSWARPRGHWAPRLSALASGAGTTLLVAVIVLRCVIRGRPPVSTLYETVLFVAATGCLLALAIEWIDRRRLGLSAAAVLGSVGVFLANGYELLDKQDTMPSLVAVLDTNFWLATHVTAITLGYSAGLLAALLGNGLLLARLLRLRRADAAWQRRLGDTVYGTLCFAAFFATVGTILGGIWANESWGRFWGWDPKENGALLIVISQVAILHARRAGRLRAFGTAWAAAFGGTIIAFSWWGVNLLGVGLHSYGFTSGIHGALWTYYLAQWGVCALALLERGGAFKSLGSVPKSRGVARSGRSAPGALRKVSAMLPRSLLRRLQVGLLASLLALSAGCASVSQLFVQQGSESSLDQVDGLLDQVEQVHVEAVLCRDRMREALLALDTLVGPEFGGDALESYARFEDAVARVEDQQDRLRARVEPMRRSANLVFASWEQDLQRYSSEALERHSRDRLEQTRARYQAILDELEPAQSGYAALAGVLRDMALFLKHDFNASAVKEIEREVTGLAHQVVKLDQRFLGCQVAAQSYVRSAALRGQMVLSRTSAPVAEAPGKGGKATSNGAAADAAPGAVAGGKR